jgi:hypothetical protein
MAKQKIRHRRPATHQDELLREQLLQRIRDLELAEWEIGKLLRKHPSRARSPFRIGRRTHDQRYQHQPGSERRRVNSGQTHVLDNVLPAYAQRRKLISRTKGRVGYLGKSDALLLCWV